MLRPLTRVTLVLVMLALAATPAVAADEYGDPTEPTGGTGPTNEIKVTGDKASGPTQVTHEDCQPDGVMSASSTRVDASEADASVASGPNLCPEHFSLRPHTHIVGSLINRYDGYYDYSTGRGCTGPCSLTASESQTWNHKFGFSIGFDKKPFSAAVGYDVSYSSQKTFSYSFPVASGVTKVVRYRDWYHVSRYNIRTVWSSLIGSWTEFGTGWGGKWYQRIFYAQTV
jgi:hypothetical protein